MNRLFIRHLVIITLITAVAACTNSGDASRSLSTVTISIGGGEGASSPARKAPPVVAAVTITITGADMTTISKSVPITPPATISEVFSVPSGSARTFAVEALDAGGTAAYRGSSTVDLDGTPVVLDIPMTPLFFAGTEQFGTAAYEEANAIARDGGGNIFIAGTTAGNLEGNANKGSLDAYIMKLDPTGSKLWTKLSGSTGAESAFGVAPDGGGGAYLFGITTDGLDGNAQAGLVDCFVTRYDGSGASQWTSQFGAANGICEAGGAATDSSGNLYITGYTDTALPGTSALGLYDAFVMKYNSSGDRLWTSVFGTSFKDYGNAISLDGAGNIFVAGQTFGSLGSAQNLNPDGTTSDLFVMKLDNALGGVLWSTQIGTAENDDAWAVAADSSGNVCVTGGTFEGLDGNVSAGSYDLFLVKFDSAGAKLWTKQAGSAANDVARAVVADASGNILVAGKTSGGMGLAANSGLNDIFVMKFDSAGNTLWISQDGTSLDDEGTGAVLDGNGNVYVSGTTRGGLDGNTNAGDADGFLQVWDAAGSLQ